MAVAGADALHEQVEAAAERFAARAAERQQNIETLSRPGGIALADTPERVKKRVQRLSRYYGDVEMARAALEPTPEVAGVVLEKTIGTPDLVDIRYLEVGARAARAVCRVEIRNAGGSSLGSGTGSLVSPRLLLTNHHVLPDAATAQASRIEFNFQDDVDGQPLQPRTFRLDPDRCFVADKKRDFALVAVLAGEDDLAMYGFNPLIEAEGKAIIGDYVAIVQHPGGRKKMVALRENRVVDLTSDYIHYEADTEPGSSGAPVFSKEWALVGLHHASVQSREREAFGGILNEGIRVSRILKHVQQQELDDRARALVSQMTGRQPPVEVPARPAAGDGDAPADRSVPAETGVGAGAAAPREAPHVATVADDAGTVRLSVPIELTLRLGSPTLGGGQATVAVDAGDDAALVTGAVAIEKIEIDPDYTNRRGYDPAFLGTGRAKVPLPALTPTLAAKASQELKYHHFSVVMNSERRLAYYTVVNIDGSKDRDPRREEDRWSFDPRLPANQQTGEEVYRSNPLDRGHLVRRIDPAWGDTAKERKSANDDTFHFTNCTPQHKDFNQSKTTWAGLEDYLLRNAQNRDFKATVFSGPVFAPDDDEYRGVLLPRQYWKVAVMRKQSGALSATAYLLSQASLIAGLEADRDFFYGAYKTFQVPVSKVEDLTGIDFGKLRDADPLNGLESTAREIERPGDLEL